MAYASVLFVFAHLYQGAHRIITNIYAFIFSYDTCQNRLLLAYSYSIVGNGSFSAIYCIQCCILLCSGISYIKFWKSPKILCKSTLGSFGIFVNGQTKFQRPLYQILHLGHVSNIKFLRHLLKISIQFVLCFRVCCMCKWTPIFNSSP